MLSLVLNIINFENERNTYSSFKMCVLSYIFDTINKPNFCPKNSFVKEFADNKNTIKTTSRIFNRRFSKN